MDLWANAMIGGHCLPALSLAAGTVRQSCGCPEGIEPLSALSNGDPGTGVSVLSPATAGQRDAVLCEIGCVTPTHRRPEIPACHCSPTTIEQSRTTSSHRLGRLALRRRTPTLLSRQPLPYQSIGCMQSAAVAQVASRGLPRGREREGRETGKRCACRR